VDDYHLVYPDEDLKTEPFLLFNFKLRKTRRRNKNRLKQLCDKYNHSCCFCGRPVARISALIELGYNIHSSHNGTGIVIASNNKGQKHTFLMATIEHLYSPLLPYADKIENLRLACRECNNNRGNPNDKTRAAI
jgi:5-methylcytosine-specific restriction endonuclease McrA